MVRYIMGILLVVAVFAVAQHQHHDMSSMSQPQQQVQAPESMEPAMPAMQHRHNDMGPHMKLTSLRSPSSEDKQRADAIVQSGRKVMERQAWPKFPCVRRDHNC